MFVHDVTNWFDHIITDTEHIIADAGRVGTDADQISTGADHHRITHSPPLPRPRPAELASAHVASIQELLESKKKTPTPVQIND